MSGLRTKDDRDAHAHAGAVQLSRADLEDGAELAVLTATRPAVELGVGVMLLFVSFIALAGAALSLNSAAGYAAAGATAAAYGAAAIGLQRRLSPTAPDPETARRLAADLVVTRDGEYELTAEGRRKVQAYRAQRN